jgi:23S rRNA (cytosine1962-C5)-methyltransferase
VSGPAGPLVRITAKGLRRARTGHPWIYRSDVAETPEGLAGGALVRVAGPDGRAFGVSAWSDRSQIALRGTPIPATTDDPGSAWLDSIDRAVARRVDRPAACRLVNADADGLPGLVVDRYGDWLSVQTMTQAADRLWDPARERLLARTGATGIVLRNDVRARDYEGLERGNRVEHGEGEPVVDVELDGVVMRFDLLGGQKTGTFLDQVDNWRIAGRLAGRAGGTALDICCYEGGFALQMARAGAQVTALDSSASALERLRANAERNGLDVSTEQANAFDALREWEQAGRRFDTIVLDPPALVKARKALEAGRRAYKELNLRAFKLLAPGGRLITCSCSANIDRADFEATVRSAAADARRFVRLLERRGAAADHPPLLNAPETDYLKAVVLEVE